QRGTLFAPIHWSGETASFARSGDLVAPHTDPHSGQPEAKATPATIAPAEFAYRGFALTRRPIALPQETWWTRAAVAGGTGYLIASNDAPKFWREHARSLMNGAEFAEFIDIRRGIYRAAAFHNGCLESCLFIGPAGTAPQWNAVKPLLESETVADLQRLTLLSGRAARGLGA